VHQNHAPPALVWRTNYSQNSTPCNRSA
jgi:hypothetical protein